MGGRLKTHMTELSQALSELGIWVRLHYVYPYPHVDDVISVDGRGFDFALFRRAIPACEPAHFEINETPSKQ